MPPKVIWRCPMIKSFHFLWAKIARKMQTFLCVPNDPKSCYLVLSNDQNLHFLWAKNAKNWKKTIKKCFVPKPPKTHLGVSSDQNLHFFVGQKCEKMQNYCKKPQKLCFAKNALKVFWRSPMTKIRIFWGPNYLPMLLPMQQPISASLCFATQKAVLVSFWGWIIACSRTNHKFFHTHINWKLPVVSDHFTKTIKGWFYYEGQLKNTLGILINLVIPCSLIYILTMQKC